jgi:hypothetical protein
MSYSHWQVQGMSTFCLKFQLCVIGMTRNTSLQHG